VKNIIAIFLIFLLISCSPNIPNNKVVEEIQCPMVYFSSEHRNYLHTDEPFISLENLSFKARIDNFSFIESCYIQNNYIYFPLEILLIINPVKPKFEINEIPVYAAVLDSNKNLLEIQYFNLKSKINKDESSGEFIESDYSDKLEIVINNQNEISYIVIGFMLDKKKKELINLIF